MASCKSPMVVCCLGPMTKPCACGDANSGEALGVLEGHGNWVCGALVLGESRLLSWSNDKTLRLWDMRTAATIAVLEGHTKHVTGAHACRRPSSAVLV